MDAVQRTRCSFQFRLQTMLAVLTLIAVALGLWTWFRQPEFDIEIRTGMGPDTPLGRAAVTGRIGELAKLLQSKQIEIDEQDGYGRTALHWAAIGGKTEAFEYLRSRGASSEIRDRFGFQAFDYDPSRRKP